MKTDGTWVKRDRIQGRSIIAGDVRHIYQTVATFFENANDIGETVEVIFQGGPYKGRRGDCRACWEL